MAKISRRNFMRGAAMGTMGAAAAGLLTACGNTASSTTSAPASSAASSEAASVVTKPSTPVDGKYVTKAMGHESWVHVATTFFEGKITACEVLSHEETIGIGNYACSRIPAAIVSTKRASTLREVLGARELLPLLASITGGEDVAHPKPHPEGLEMALDQLGLPPERVLYCGDTVLDAEAAQRAGLEFAAVLNGTTPASAFDVWPHVFLARDLDALARFLEGRTRPAV